MNESNGNEKQGVSEKSYLRRGNEETRPFRSGQDCNELTSTASASAAATTTSTAVTASATPVIPGVAITLTDDVGGTPLLLHVIVCLGEGDGLILIERFEAFLDNGRKVNKHVLTPIIGSDKAKALVRKELHLSSHGSVRHD